MKDLKYYRHITFPKILWYITGRFILEFILDFSHNIQGKEPYWDDADSCKKYFCRYCGGRFYKIINTNEKQNTSTTQN